MKIIFALVLWGAVSAFSHQAVMTKIESLNETEAYAPMIFHNHFLWLGRVDYSKRKNVHRIEVRTPDGEMLLSSHIIPHSVERLYPFDQDAILIMGKSFTASGWITYYSIVRSCCGAMAVETHPIPLKFQVEEFAGNSEVLYFNETGDRGIVAQSSSGTTLLPFLVSGPGQMQLLGDSLWVLERQSFYLGDENIARINLKTMKADRVFPTLRKGLVSILALKDGSALATAEHLEENVILIDAKDPAQQTLIPLQGTHPRSLAQWGRCLLVASEYPNRLTMINLGTKKPEIVFEFNLEPYAADLPNLKKMSVDPGTGNVFLRSAVIPEPGTSNRNSVYRFTHSSWINDCAVKE